MTRPDPAQFRKALGRFATGVTVVTVESSHGQVHGMTANAFTSVSLNPLLVLVSVDHAARTHPLLHARQRFGINILAEHQQAISDYFARTDQDHESAHRLGVRYRYSDGGVPLLDGCLVNLACRVVASHEAGDHTLFIGEVEQIEQQEGRPLLYHGGRYAKLTA